MQKPIQRTFLNVRLLSKRLLEFFKTGVEVETDHSSSKPLRLVHHHPGYFRAQADLFLGDGQFNPAVQTAQSVVEAVPGFLNWTHHPKTGSFVVEYQPGELVVDELIEKIAEAVGLSGVVTELDSNAHRTTMIQSMIGAVEEINEIVYEATGKKADLRELIPAGLAINSVVAFILGDKRPSRLPSWDSSLYRAYRIFMQTHKEDLKTVNERRGKKNKKEKKNKKKKSDEVALSERESPSVENLSTETT